MRYPKAILTITYFNRPICNLITVSDTLSPPKCFNRKKVRNKVIIRVCHCGRDNRRVWIGILTTSYEQNMIPKI